MPLRPHEIRENTTTGQQLALATMTPEKSPHEPSQLSFLAPEDVQLLAMMNRFVAEASRLYEPRPGTERVEPYRIQRPQDAYDLLRGPLAELPHEQLHTLNLDVRQRVISRNLIYQGTIRSVHVRVAELFRPAIVANAAALMVVHNHPSGDPEPSPEDVRMTHELVKAGRLLDLEVLDHIVIAKDGYVSLRERGLGFER